VPVQSDTELISFQEWTARVRPATESFARLLVLVHGWTGDENSMWVFVRNFPGSYWIVAPRAPYTTASGGYSWRLQRTAGHDYPTLEDLRPGAEALLQLVDAYAPANHLDAAQFDAMGFSQGAALVTGVALLHPERVRRVAALAGFVPHGAGPLAASRPLAGKPFFVAHGTRDEMVSSEMARRSVQVLEEVGANVTYCEDNVGHKLSANCLRALQAFFA
jgi:phospholipase/carboxylesterase